MLFYSINPNVTKLTKQTKQMSTTVMMPPALELALTEMIADAMTQTVAKLSEKYEFDAEEAKLFLEFESVKIVHKRGPSPKKTEKKTKKEKKVKDPDAPKRAKSAYLLFCDSVRDEVKAENPDLSPQDVVRALALRWKEQKALDSSESESEKQV